MNGQRQVYLGDGVYAHMQEDAILLTTQDGRITTNRIWLDPHVYQALVEWVRSLRQDPPPDAPEDES